MEHYKAALELAKRLGATVAPKNEPTECIARTPGQLAELLVDRMELLELDIPDLASASGVPAASVERLVTTGKGRLDDTHAVLDTLNLIPIAIPYPWDEEQT